MLFLTGVSSIMFGQLAAVVSFSLAMSLLVAVTIVPVLCSRFLDPPHVIHGRGGIMSGFNRRIDGWLNDLDAFYARMLHLALAHRPTVFAAGFGLFAVAVLLMGQIGFEFQPQTDEGEVRVDTELAVGTRIERTEAVMIGLEERIRQTVPEATMLITQAGGGGWGNSSTHRGNIDIRLVPRGERTRSNEDISMQLRRELNGIPGVIVRARPSGGQQMRGMGGGGQDGRLSIEILGHDLEASQNIAQDLKTLLDTTPGVADTRLQREEGRPELAVRVDRDKAALLGLTVTGVANTIRTNVAGTQAAMFRDAGNEYPIVVRLRQSDREEVS
jgi:HAE1 family hydrophobic/amphiphilic exporter-1